MTAIMVSERGMAILGDVGQLHAVAGTAAKAVHAPHRGDRGPARRRSTATETASSRRGGLHQLVTAPTRRRGAAPREREADQGRADLGAGETVPDRGTQTSEGERK